MDKQNTQSIRLNGTSANRYPELYEWYQLSSVTGYRNVTHTNLKLKTCQIKINAELLQPTRVRARANTYTLARKHKI